MTRRPLWLWTTNDALLLAPLIAAQGYAIAAYLPRPVGLVAGGVLVAVDVVWLVLLHEWRRT